LLHPIGDGGPAGSGALDWRCPAPTGEATALGAFDPLIPSRAFATRRVSPVCDVVAPDQSEIRLLLQTAGGALTHCTLLPGRTSLAVRHRTVEEIWYCISGSGEVWRRQDDREEVVQVDAGVVLTIPLGVHFQFRNQGVEPLVFVIATMPPWPGDAEAVRVPGHWEC
jgi:mannose-6-phosphate isomerase-like protein (cupin superfamily)